MLNRLRISNFYIAACNKLCQPLSHAVFSPSQKCHKKKSDHQQLTHAKHICQINNMERVAIEVPPL